MNRNILIGFAAGLFLTSTVGMAKTPISLNVYNPNFQIKLTNQTSYRETIWLEASRVLKFGPTSFTLIDSQSQTFGCLNAILNGNGSADIAANLALKTPSDLEGTGFGNTVSIEDFESGFIITDNTPVTVDSNITDHDGGVPYSVPEPFALIIIGACIFSVSGIAQRKTK